MNIASNRGSEIRSALQVNPKLEGDVELKMELERRIDFIKDTVRFRYPSTSAWDQWRGGFHNRWQAMSNRCRVTSPGWL